MDSHTFTELSNGKIFPKGEIFMSLNGDFYSVCRATQYLFWNLVWKWGWGCSQSELLFILSWEKAESKRKKTSSITLTLIGLHSATAFWLCPLLANLWKEIQIHKYLSHPSISYFDIIHDYLAWRKKSNYQLISEKISFPNHVVISVPNLDCVTESSLGKIWHICLSMLFFEK